ncbi:MULTISPECIES: MarR family winged helix-turn-helix transcriptional regulator [Methanobacterium]|jgi:DNA-binding MarR family transcriptional regulator|uniref:MarR family transcriptional regulator n=1 Tax=Methanobacterium veterum TaxID=408577 RepID=A0A9E4ZWN8_9EURY|nr:MULTISPECIES: MarR family transcriptional regulator [Methanobacterium]MCZ3366601.1 MarR family transcriptional regulator [Methanobacterium veterum]MCZ3374255.1 MarR family transcriptional regulator [Methanobacterium veterum]
MDEEKLGEMLDNLFLLYQLFQKNVLKYKTSNGRIKMSFAHYLTLIILKERGELSISEIGTLIGMKKQNMTYLTNKLVEDGLIQRLHDMSDRRVIKIALTGKGDEYLDKWRKSKIEETKEDFSFYNDKDMNEICRSIENIKQVFLRIDNGRKNF